MRRDWRPMAGAVAVGLVSGMLGLRWADAVLVGLIAAVVIAVFVMANAAEPAGWPPARAVETAGTRRDVSALTWSFIGLDGRVSEAAVRRLRVDASRRLAHIGVVVPGGLRATTVRDTDEAVQAAAREALGDRAWRILTAPGGFMPSLADVAHCVDVVERLAPGPAIAPIVSSATVTGSASRQGARAVRGFRTGAPRRTDLSRAIEPPAAEPSAAEAHPHELSGPTERGDV